MTCFRGINTPGALALDALEELSDQQMYAATGITKDAITKKTRPTNPNRALAFADAVGLEAALETAGRPARFAGLFADMVRRKVAQLGGAPYHEPMDPRERLKGAIKELADVILAVERAMEDGQPTPQQRAEMVKEAYEMRDLIDKLIRDVEPPAAGPRLVREG